MTDYAAKHLYILKAGGTYTHHGLGIGEGRVIHYSGLVNNLTSEAVIEIVSVEEFSQGHRLHVKKHKNMSFKNADVVRRGLSRLGERQYDILHNNCEHFVNWCLSGVHKSRQARNAKLLYSAGIGARVLSGTRNPAAFILGAVAGYAYVNYAGLKKHPDIQALETRIGAYSRQ